MRNTGECDVSISWTQDNSRLIWCAPNFFRKYRICDEEVGILAPALIDKTGHNLDKIRQEVRKLIAELYHVFPVSKIVPFLVEGAKHKNTRTRSECMEEIGVLLQRHGIATCSSAHNRVRSRM